MEYCSAKELSKRWDITPARITAMCAAGKISGAFKENGCWRIPQNTIKPKDGRRKDKNAKFRFIDLFAGIGGFHQAMRFLGGECIMAAEINQACIKTYRANFKTREGKIRGDVNQIDPETIDDFDVLCAGFPCQPFSKAGLQKGFKDETRGNLFYGIMRILDKHEECKYVILENVRNLADKTENWEVIKSELEKRNFVITKNPIILSPSDFGIPQKRERVYILGIKRNECISKIKNKGYIDESDLNIQKHKKKCKMGSAMDILERDAAKKYRVSSEQELMLEAWEEFRENTNLKVIGFPIWISCFGVGIDNDEDSRKAIGYYKMPDWKKKYVDKNRALYLANRHFIDAWIQKYDMRSRIKLFQKFEWNCGEDVVDMKSGIIQIRQSGIRVKRPDYYPSLVAIVNTPIIWDKQKEYFRFITPREAANLQNFDKRYKFVGSDKNIYKQLGNSVNVRILKLLCRNLFNLRKEGFDEQ